MVRSNQAEELNTTIKENNLTIFNFLSERGKGIFFPKEGILSQSAEAKGSKINATIGVAIEDDGTPMRLQSIEEKIRLNPNDVFLYAPSFGQFELREAWKREIIKKNPSMRGNISLPVVTNGVTHGLHIVGYLFINPADEIILPDKFWGNYKLIFENGFSGKLTTFNLFRENRFDIVSFVEKLLENEGKKIVLFNFPNNPTGYSPTNKEAEKIVDAIKEYADKGNKICIICDDAYFGLFYKQNTFQESLFSLLADLDENILAIKVDGATKEYYVWGLRVGFVTYASKGITEEGCRALESKTAGVVRGGISNVSNLSQNLVLEALRSPKFESEKKEKYELLKSRFEKVEEVLNDKKISEGSLPISHLPYNSGYFMCLELPSEEHAEKVRQILLNKYQIGVIAVKNLLRIAYASVAIKDIRQLFDSIYKAYEETLKENYGKR